MEKIIGSPYYMSVHACNTLDSGKYNFYGLLNIKQNRFYILHRNHSLLKFLQLVLLKNFYSFSIVSFKHFNFDTNKDIDNHDCINWGGSPELTSNLELEANTSMHQAKLINYGLGTVTDIDFVLQEKLFFVMALLGKIDDLFTKLRNYEIDIKKPAADGYSELKKYLQIICPNDKTIDNFITKENTQLHAKTLLLDSYWNKFLLFLYNVDLRNNSIESASKLLQNLVQTPEFEMEQFKRLYKHPYDAIDELYTILGIGTKI